LSNTLHYIEEWSREADLRSEMASDRFRRLAEVMEAAAEPPVFKIERIGQSYGLEYVEAALKGRE
jgi:hypothetical protein